ncbi:MAG: prepilin-type N-terminal cleavage/methylation domain-containing protein [Candidatus Niyogibacteria bacterium]|nr:prepilin-type N-terminal cleavage/methylation domain-containing protein [Candidatus Niyogibacteria bacterium]
MKVKSQKSKVKSFCGGFSLLETLVALAVLTAAVTGPMNLATVSIRSASLAHNNIIASFLAEEGMELVRAKRDAGAYGGGWLSNLGPCTGGQSCIINVVDGAVSACSGTCPKIKYDSTTGLFSQAATGNDSIFTRTISITTLNANEVQVVVAMSWKERFLPQNSQVEIKTNLSNWK